MVRGHQECSFVVLLQPVCAGSTEVASHVCKLLLVEIAVVQGMKPPREVVSIPRIGCVWHGRVLVLAVRALACAVKTRARANLSSLTGARTVGAHHRETPVVRERIVDVDGACGA